MEAAAAMGVVQVDTEVATAAGAAATAAGAAATVAEGVTAVVETTAVAVQPSMVEAATAIFIAEDTASAAVGPAGMVTATATATATAPTMGAMVMEATAPGRDITATADTGTAGTAGTWAR